MKNKSNTHKHKQFKILAVHKEPSVCELTGKRFKKLVCDIEINGKKVICEPVKNTDSRWEIFRTLPLMLIKNDDGAPTFPANERLTHEAAKAEEELVSNTLQRLFFLAENEDAYASLVLLNCAKKACLHLDCLAEHHPHLLEKFARQDICWPTIISNKPDATQRRIKHLIGLLNIGKDCPHRGNWHAEAPSTKLAVIIDLWLRQNADKLGLPQLSSPKIAQEWFAIGWDAFEFANISNNSRLAENEWVKEIGKSAINEKRLGKRAVRLCIGRVTDAMKKCAIEEKAKELTKKAFLVLTQNFYS